MARGDGEWSGGDGEIRRRAGVGDANIDEGLGLRYKCEDVRADGRADVGRFDLRCSAELLDERSEMANKAIVAEAS
jgi:hypothetical protein